MAPTEIERSTVCRCFASLRPENGPARDCRCRHAGCRLPTPSAQNPVRLSPGFAPMPILPPAAPDQGGCREASCGRVWWRVSGGCAVAGGGSRRSSGSKSPRQGLMAATPKIPARGAGRREIGAASTSTSTLDIGTRQGRAPPGSAHPLWGAMMRNPAAFRPVGAFGAWRFQIFSEPPPSSWAAAGRPGSIIGRCPALGWIPACAAAPLGQDDGGDFGAGRRAAQCARATQKSTVSFSACFIGEAGKRASASFAILA